MIDQRKWGRIACVLVCCSFMSFGEVASGQDDEASKTVYLDKLKKRREEYRLEQETKKKGPNFNSELASQMDVSKIYDYQIENAEELIESGGVFGEDEFKAAALAIYKESNDASNRVSESIEARLKRQFAEADMVRDKAVAASNAKLQEVIDRHDEQRRLSVESRNLVTKFHGNVGKIGLMIWNLPVGKKLHNRFTLVVNIQLYAAEKLVWNRNGVKLSPKEAKNLIPLPNVLFDRVVLEIPKWAGSGSGLSEVGVFVGDENIALSRPCEVTSIETLPAHLDDKNALTDGITEPIQVGEGYWIPEEKTKSTITIYLLGKKMLLTK